MRARSLSNLFTRLDVSAGRRRLARFIVLISFMGSPPGKSSLTVHVAMIGPRAERRVGVDRDVTHASRDESRSTRVPIPWASRRASRVGAPEGEHLSSPDSCTAAQL